MDYSRFLDDEFDAKAWVNNAFRSNKESSNDQYATTLVMKMQMFIQEVNNVIEDSCQQAVTNLPRVMRELEAVKQEALMLQDQMKTIKYDIQKVEQETAESMQTLLKLDTIKARMKAASDALREADNWTTLSTDVEEVLESGDVDAITSKLVGMQQSLQILTDVPDYVERCHYLESLKNRLEALLSPHVVAAFSSQSLEAAQKYASVFASIDRSQQLCKYYHNCHKAQLEQMWQNTEIDQSHTNVVNSLSEFYEQLLHFWQVQVKWCSQVFTDPVSIISDLLSDVLFSLQPRLSQSFDVYITSSGLSPVAALIALRQVTDSFALKLEVLTETPALGSALYTPCVQRLASACYAPFRDYMCQFGDYEDTTLSDALDAIPMDHHEILDCVVLLQESVSKLFAAAHASNQRCIELTSGCGYIILSQTLQEYIRRYIAQFERILVNIREKCRLDSSAVDAEEWSTFQNSLRIIQTCGDVILHAEELDQLLISSVVSTVGKYVNISSPSHQHSRTSVKLSPFRDYKTLLLASNDDRQALQLLMKQLDTGDSVTLLESARQDIHTLCSHVHQFAFDIVFAPLKLHLADVPTMPVWKSETTGMALTSNLPDFSLAPQEYITQVGQYLMTLPQQLEPFTMSDNPMLAVALRHGKLPYISELAEVSESTSNQWLESVARGTVHVFTEHILKIRELTEQSTKQLIMDIEYLMNVLDDLGLEATDNIKTLLTLLQAAPDQYSELAEQSPQRLAGAVASLRRLKLTH